MERQPGRGHGMDAHGAKPVSLANLGGDQSSSGHVSVDMMNAFHNHLGHLKDLPTFAGTKITIVQSFQS